MSFYLTFMGGSEVRLKEQDNIVATMWGGTEILMPTLAEKMLRIRKVKAEFGEITDAVTRRTNVITLMGGTVYRQPTLAHEIEDMVQLRETGAIPERELMELWQEALRREDMDIFESLTVMGGTGYERPSTKQEVQDLARIAARGVITQEDHDELKTILRGDVPAGLSNSSVQEKLRSLVWPSRSIEQFPTMSRQAFSSERM